MNRRLRSAGITASIGLLAAGTLIGASPSHADEAPDLVTALYLLPAGGGWPQPYTGLVVNRDDLGAFGPTTDGLLCGRTYQADVETRADFELVTADGVLNEGEDYGKALRWNVFTTPACVTATPTPTMTAPVTLPVTSNPTPSPTRTPSPSETPAATPSPSKTASSGPTESPTTSTSSASGTATAAALTQQKTGTDQAADSLAYTGSETGWLRLIAFSFVVVGIALVTRAAVLRRRQRRNGSAS